MENKPAVFKKPDWAAFWIALIISLGVYVYTLAPTVTLEDSGELVVAADYLGVPHPPGYPVWTIVSWIFTAIFSFVKFRGLPNPAWAVNLVSAVFSAFTCAFTALIVSRTSLDMVRKSLKDEEGDYSILQIAGGVCAGLLLAFSPIMWSQSVIAEVYTLNTFLHIIMLVFAYIWMKDPTKDKYFYLTAFMFGLALTNCQPIVLLIPALMTVIWFRNRKLFRDCIAALFLVIALVIAIHLRVIGPAVPMRGLWVTVALLCVLAPFLMWAIFKELFTEWKIVLIAALCVLAGLAFFLYMPLASDFNPPMNWGYPRTWEGFKHAVTRGQYQKLDSAWPWSNPLRFLEQEYMFLVQLEEQFTLPILLIALIPFLFVTRMNRENRRWLAVIVIAFYFLSFIIVILNPSHDIQSMFIAKVQFVQAIAVFTILLGLGFVLGLAWLSKTYTGPATAKALAVFLAAALPFVLILQNEYNEEAVDKFGSSEQRGHDFGWQFGRYQLEGARGILAEMRPDAADDLALFDTAASIVATQDPDAPSLPDPDYPPEMTTNAIFYGGTDPGRFVPTYMIYSGGVRSDVYLITQNALADNTYMNVMRDLYGNQIWIPSAQDSNHAFQQYLEDVKAGKIPKTSNITIDPSGRVSVQGVQGVMEINGIIAKQIFENNKSKHDFYVEESYVIQWMYPYLEPHGLIMKINKEPLDKLSDEMIKNDRDFWDWYVARLLNDRKFRRDVVARKSFSKLRCAIAGLYAYRGLFDEAEYAYMQAVELYPMSPEANFRLADIYVKAGKIDKALEIMEENKRLDPKNDKIDDFTNQLKALRDANRRIAEIESLLQSQKATVEHVLELADIFRKVGRIGDFYNLAMQVIENKTLPPGAYLSVAQMCITTQPVRYEIIARAFKAYLEKEPGNPHAWLDLAATQMILEQKDSAYESLEKAVKIGGAPLRDIIMQDTRFKPLHSEEKFQKLVTPAQNRFIF